MRNNSRSGDRLGRCRLAATSATVRWQAHGAPDTSGCEGKTARERVPGSSSSLLSLAGRPSPAGDSLNLTRAHRADEDRKPVSVRAPSFTPPTPANADRCVRPRPRTRYPNTIFRTNQTLVTAVPTFVHRRPNAVRDGRALRPASLGAQRHRRSSLLTLHRRHTDNSSTPRATSAFR
jgi:hypothetical protein